MEVHPPDHALHTWRDFFVHMGTICLGLLIAIGLEQTVETLHHRHELASLRQAMREDAEKNRREVLRQNADELLVMQWLKSRMSQVQTALGQRTPLAASPLYPKWGDEDYPSDPSWLAAKTSGVLSFMPEDEIKGYAEISKWIALIEPEVLEWDRATRKRKAFEAGFCSGPCLDGSFAAATPAELRQYLGFLEEERETLHWDWVTVHAVYGGEGALLSGERDLKNIQTAESGPMPNGPPKTH